MPPVAWRCRSSPEVWARHGDYLLYVEAKAAVVIEAKSEGHTVTGVEAQPGKYHAGFPENLPTHVQSPVVPVREYRDREPVHQGA